MKHIKKFNEELNTINSKDLDSWSVPKANEPKKKNGSKILDREIGQKVLDLFERNELIIELNNQSGRQYSLPGEDDFIEWRCDISRKEPFEDWLYGNYSESEDELNKKTLKERQKEYNSKEQPAEMRDCEFSVYLPKGVKDIQSALADASTYLSQLNNSAIDVMKGGVERHDLLTNEPEQLKKFLKLRKIIINNDNIEILPDIAYRLYYDCKFVSSFYNEFGDSEGKEFFSDWLEILGEKCNF